MKLEVNDIKKINLFPGETLVVRYNKDRMVPILLKRFKIDFTELFPDSRLLLIPDSIEIDTIIRKTED